MFTFSSSFFFFLNMLHNSARQVKLSSQLMIFKLAKLWQDSKTNEKEDNWVGVEQLSPFQTSKSLESGKYIQSSGRKFCWWYHTKKQINKKNLVFKNIMENGKMKKENKTNIQFLEIEIKSPLSSYSIKFYRSLVGFFWSFN